MSDLEILYKRGALTKDLYKKLNLLDNLYKAKKKVIKHKTQTNAADVVDELINMVKNIPFIEKQKVTKPLEGKKIIYKKITTVRKPITKVSKKKMILKNKNNEKKLKKGWVMGEKGRPIKIGGPTYRKINKTLKPGWMNGEKGRPIKINGPTHKKILKARLQFLEQIKKDAKANDDTMNADYDKIKGLLKKIETKVYENKRMYQITVLLFRELTDEDDINGKKIIKIGDIEYIQYNKMTITIRSTISPDRYDFYIPKIIKSPEYVYLNPYWIETAHYDGILHTSNIWSDYFAVYSDYIDAIRIIQVKSLFKEQREVRKMKKKGITFDQKINNLHSGGIEKKIMNRYINYDLNNEAQIFNDLFDIEIDTKYVLDNFKANSCYINTIVDTYYKPFEQTKNNGKRRYAELTYQKLCDILKIKHEEQNIGLSINQSLNFFKRYRLGLDVINIYDELMYTYRPEKLNTNIRPQILRILVHNNHCYKLNDNIATFAHTLEKLTWTDLTDTKVSDRYHIRNTEKNNEINHYAVTSLDDVTEILKCDSEATCIRFINDEKLEDLLFDCIDNNYIPEVNYQAGKLLGLSFKVGDKKCSIQKSDITAPEDNDIKVNMKDLDKYADIDNKFYSQIIKKEYLSEFPENVLKMEEQYYMKASSGYFKGYGEADEWVYNGIDMRKAYSTCLREINEVPIFDYFDQYVNWKDNDTIREYDMYIIECTVTINKHAIMFDNKYTRCFGFKLLYAQKCGFKFKIHYVRRYSKLEQVQYKKAVDELYAMEDIPMDNRKYIANKTTGLLEKKRNKRYICKLFATYLEAQHYQIKYGGGDIIVLGDSDLVMSGLIENVKKRGRMYLLIFKKKQTLSNGFRYIKEMIYNKMNVKMFELYKCCIKSNLKVVGVKTDCIIVHNSEEEIEATGYFDFTDKLGCLKYEPGAECVNKLLEQKINNLCALEHVKVNEITINDEYSVSEFKNVFDNNNRVLLKGLLPGVGKTTAVKNYSGRKLLFVTPFNKLASEIKKSGHNVTTVNMLLGVFGDGQDYKKMKGCDVSAYDTICFDEVYLMPPSYLKRVDKFIHNHPKIKFLATGDLNQIDPIGYEGSNEYHDACVNYVFPNQITLKINKRVKTEEERELLTKLKQDIFSNKDIMKVFRKYKFDIIKSMSELKTTKNLCYFNKNVDKVNRHMHKKATKPKKTIMIDGIEYYKGLEIICRDHYKAGKGMRFFVNYTYIIKDINKKTFTICDEFDGKTYNNINIKLMKHFKLGYAHTVHSCQGLSIDEPMTIFDTNTVYSDKKIIWTAITRATDLNNITIFEHSEQEKTALYYAKIRQYFRLKIEGYERQDKKAGREWKAGEYITNVWLSNELKKHNKCSNCKKLYEIDIDDDNKVRSNITVDRINNDRPHIINNCQLRCLACNRARSNHF